MPSTRKSCIRVLKTDEVIFKDPLGTLPRVYAAFLLGVLSIERINERVFIMGPEKGPWYRRKVMWFAGNLEKYKIRERKYEDPDRV